MSYPILDLNNSNNWELIWSQQFQAQRSPGNTAVLAIPEADCPVPLDKHILAILVTSSNAKPTWYFAGFLNQKIPVGFTVSINSSQISDAVQRRKILLNQITLIVFPQLVSIYSLSFTFPKWFQDATVYLWKYIGTEADSTDNLVSLAIAQIQTINTKIDTLLQK